MASTGVDPPLRPASSVEDQLSEKGLFEEVGQIGVVTIDVDK